MDYREALERLELFRTMIERHMKTRYSSDEEARQLAKQIYESYGEVEDIIERFAGRAEIPVGIHARIKPTIYPNLIEAGFLSGSTFHSHQGYTQLVKIIGKVKRLAESPAPPTDEQSISGVVRVLSRLRECCQYLKDVPANERAVQYIVWIMLRSHFDRLDRENTLSRFGVKNYRPDFGIPDLRTLIEIKFIGEKTEVSGIQEGIFADLPGYLADQNRYDGVIILIYDAAHKLRDPRGFIDDVRTVDGVIDVLVIPGFG